MHTHVPVEAAASYYIDADVTDCPILFKLITFFVTYHIIQIM
jgi:hypothetical protein